jgi:mannosyltransferase OCH1-like enzyme
MPDYEIRVWDANSFDFDSVPFVRDAYKAKKWAFVADYIRLYALYTEGGIYLDSDVKVFKRFDEFLDNEMFIGTEPLAHNNVELEAAIMGSVPNHTFLHECLTYYHSLDFQHRDTVPTIMSQLLEPHGYEYVNRNQLLPNGVHVYDRTYFGHCFGTEIGNIMQYTISMVRG